MSIIIGAGGHAREVYDALRGRDVQAFAVEKDWVEKAPAMLFGVPVLPFEQALRCNAHFIIAIGDIAARRRIAQAIYESLPGMARGPWSFECAVDPTARLPYASAKSWWLGAQILSGVLLGNAVRVGVNSIVNHGAILCHDVAVGDFCNIGPGAILCGGAVIEDDCDIGCGARILPKVTVHKGAIIGAGAVVTKDVPGGETWLGVPARPIQGQKGL